MSKESKKHPAHRRNSPSTPPPRNKPFPIVGIGASAGGLEAMTQLLRALPVDAVQIANVFQNLIANALKFRSEDPPEICVGARQENEAWVIWVRDNGMGLAPQYFQRIFQVFQRLHTRKKHPGTGIGLAICKKIVERHGGRIWVESAPGKGATFYFTLPDSR